MKNNLKHLDLGYGLNTYNSKYLSGKAKYLSNITRLEYMLNLITENDSYEDGVMLVDILL